MEKVSEMTTEPIVGKFYLVECIELRGEWVPVVGAAHSDPDILPQLDGKRGVHWHRDIRFLPPRMDGGYNRQLAAIVYKFPSDRWGHSLGDARETQLLKRKCRHHMPEFPNTDRVTGIIERQFIGRKTLCGKCPHKGFPIESLPKDKTGLVICNGHGLAIKDGVVVKREFPAAKGERG